MADNETDELYDDDADFPTGEEEEQPPEATASAETGDAEPEAADNAPEAAEEEAQEEAQQQKTVPYGALKAERERRKELSEQNRQLREQMQQFLTLRDELKQLREGREPDPEERFREEYEKDPIEAMRKRLDQFEQAQRQQTEHSERQHQQSEQYRAFVTEVSRQVGEFTQEHPDYQDALRYVMDRRVEDYRAMGLRQDEIPAAWEQETTQWAATALNRDQNPAELVYSLAQRWGYNHHKEAPSPTKERVERIKRGQKADPSEAPGGQGGWSVSDIAQMPDEEFDKLWEEMERDAYSSN